MDSRTAKHFDDVYSSQSITFGKGKPLKLVRDILDYKKSGKVLDIGGGEGRNALFLAQKGFDVEIIDLSSVGIEKTRTKAKELGLSVKTKVADITEEALGEYDVIILSYVLHLIPKPKAEALMKKVKECTASEGLNVVTAFTKEGDFYKENPGVKSYYLELGELRGLYEDWGILNYKEERTKAFKKREDGSAMFNVSAMVLARKPVEG